MWYEYLGNWAIAYLAAIMSLLIATANGKSGLSRRMELVVARYLPQKSHRLLIRYTALLLIGLFAAAYTILGIKASGYQSIFASAISSTFAIELLPGTPPENKPEARKES